MNDIINFMKKNRSFYEEYFYNDRLSKCYYGYTCDVDQIYCLLNKIELNKTIYYQFYKLCLKYFNLHNKNILDVASGKIPILSLIFNNYGYNITAIDKKIIKSTCNHIKTIEYDLKNDFDFSKYDIIVGIRPCEITEKILKEICSYKKDFIIYLCPCIHNCSSGKVNHTYEEWIDYLKWC